MTWLTFEIDCAVVNLDAAGSFLRGVAFVADPCGKRWSGFIHDLR